METHTRKRHNGSKTTIESLTEPEEILLLNAIKQWPSLKNRPAVQHRNFTMALLMLDAGLRVGEVAGLKITQLFYVNEPVSYLDLPASETKTNFGRSIPVSLRLKEAIDRMNLLYWRKLPTKPEFYAFYVTIPTLPLTTRQIERVIAQAALFSIGRRVHPHELRHTFATKLMRKTNIRVVQSLLGHKSLQSTQVYTHPNHKDLQEPIDPLNTVTVKNAQPVELKKGVTL